MRIHSLVISLLVGSLYVGGLTASAKDNDFLTHFNTQLFPCGYQQNIYPLLAVTVDSMKSAITVAATQCNKVGNTIAEKAYTEAAAQCHLDTKHCRENVYLGLKGKWCGYEPVLTGNEGACTLLSNAGHSKSEVDVCVKMLSASHHCAKFDPFYSTTSAPNSKDYFGPTLSNMNFSCDDPSQTPSTCTFNKLLAPYASVSAPY